jgi:hypothetical protein
MRPLLILLAASVLALAQAPEQPRLDVEAPQYDFGPITPDQPVTHRFKARNVGNAPLAIDRLQPTCGCTSTLVGQSALEPGESTELEVTFNPQGYKGTVIKEVHVLSSDPVAPDQTLTLRAEVQPTVLAPTQRVDFLDLRPGQRRRASVKVASGTAQDLQLTNVDLSEAPWLGVATREEGKVIWVDFDLVASRLPLGRLTGTDSAVLHLANPDPSLLTLQVHWEQRPPVRVEPQRVAWSQPAGQELTATLKLLSRQGKPFRILSARTSHTLLTVDGLATRPAARQTVQVHLSADARPGTYAEKVFLTLDSPGHPELEVPVAAVLD